MVFQTHPRRFLALLGAVLVSSTLSCRRASNEPQNEVARRGDDVLATGSMATIMDSVPGDAILASGNVSFGGVTGGDYLGAGGKQTITGRIHGSLRAAGGEVHVAAAVDRNATIAGGAVGLDSATVIAKNAYLMGGTVQVDGTVRGALLASGGMIILNGVVGRDVEVAGGALRIGPHAQIAGNLRYRVPAGKVRIDPAARITGTVTAIPVAGRWGLKRVLWLLGFLMMGAVAGGSFPRLYGGGGRDTASASGPIGTVRFGMGDPGPNCHLPRGHHDRRATTRAPYGRDLRNHGVPGDGPVRRLAGTATARRARPKRA